MPDDRLWTVNEVAAYLGVHRATVYTLAIRWVKVGRCRRYNPADVRTYVTLNSWGTTRATA